MQALVTVTLGAEVHHPRGVNGHHEIPIKEAVFVQRLLLQQGLHQLILEVFQRLIGQPTQNLVDSIQVRQAQPQRFRALPENHLSQYVKAHPKNIFPAVWPYEGLDLGVAGSIKETFTRRRFHGKSRPRLS